MSVLEDFMRRVEFEPNSGCWLWSAGQSHYGYGTFQMHKRTMLAHRASWELHHGAAPVGLVCHHCDTPACVNPDHLFVGDQAANMADMRRKGRADRKFGQRNGRARLTDDVARELLDVASLGSFTQREIARSYGIPETTLSRLLRRESFPHVWPYQVA